MSNDEEIREDQVTRGRLPTPPGIGYRGKTLAKFCLLSLGVPLLVGVACLLLGART